MGLESISDFSIILLLISGDNFLSNFKGDGFGGKNDLLRGFGGSLFKISGWGHFFFSVLVIVIFFLDLVVNKFIRSELSLEYF